MPSSKFCAGALLQRDVSKNSFFHVEALVVVRDTQHHAITEALEGLQAQHGVHLDFVLCDIPDHEDWGTADSLRHIRSKVKVVCS